MDTRSVYFKQYDRNLTLTRNMFRLLLVLSMRNIQWRPPKVRHHIFNCIFFFPHAKKKTERYLEKPRKTIHKSKNVWHLCGPRKVEQSSCYSKMTKDNGKCANIDQYGSKIVSYQSSEVHRLCWVECVLCRKAFCILNDCLWLSSTLFTISREKVTNILKNSLNNELGQFCYSKTCYTVQMFPHKEAECFNYFAGVCDQALTYLEWCFAPIKLRSRFIPTSSLSACSFVSLWLSKNNTTSKNSNYCA